MHQALSVDMEITARGGAQDRLSNPCDGGLRGTWPQQLLAATVGSCLDTGLCLARGHGAWDDAEGKRGAAEGSQRVVDVFPEEEPTKEGLPSLAKNSLLIRPWMAMILRSPWRNFWPMKT